MVSTDTGCAGSLEEQACATGPYARVLHCALGATVNPDDDDDDDDDPKRGSIEPDDDDDVGDDEEDDDDDDEEPLWARSA